MTALRFAIPIPRGGPPDKVIQIPSRDAGRSIKTHVYCPKAAKNPSPVLVNLHGSGFVIPAHGMDDEFCRYIASKTDYTVLDISYRVAPENPFPAAVNDVEDAIKWVLDRPAEFELSRIALSGFSAGGNLALVACSSTFSKGTFRSVVAFYPPTDLSTDPERKIAPDKNGKPIPSIVARFFDKCYVPAGNDLKDPSISPAFAPPENFPNEMIFITCAGDSLALEAEQLADRIKAVPGNHVVIQRLDCNHGWDKYKMKEGSSQEKAKNHSYALAAETLRH